jgi:methyl-accepting chemotaxis protein
MTIRSQIAFKEAGDMTKEMPWRKTLGARLGMLSVAILVSAILLIVADFQMLGEIDAARAQTNVLGHDRSDAYQLLALTERLARDTGESRAGTLGEISDVRGQIDRRFDAARGAGSVPSDGAPGRTGPGSGQRRETFWRSQIVPVLDRLTSSHDPETLSALNASVKRYVSEMDDIQKDIDAAARRDADRFRTLQFGFLLFVAFVCLVTLYLVHDAARRVRVLVQVAEQSSSGDHAADAPPLGEDEVGRLGEAWNGVLATIRHLLGEEKAARVRLETLLAGVSETANGISAAAAELLAGTTEQTAAAQQQAEAVAQTVSTVNEVAETSRQAAERAPSVADAANRAVEIARAGRKAVDDTVVGLRSVKDQVQAITEGTMALAEQGQAIGEITSTVKDLAEQTNLLALNAAIEASRAGEQGKGFAVVAGEVKALADQSKKATAQVRQILGQIQKATTSAVAAAEEGKRSVDAAVMVALQAGETIRALGETVTESGQVVGQMAASAGQQATGMSQIHHAMSNINQASSQHLAATQQANRTAQALSDAGRRLTAMMP